MKKCLMLLVPVLPLLVACNGSSSAPLAEEEEISSSVGGSKLEVIKNNLAVNLGNQCLLINSTTDFIEAFRLPNDDPYCRYEAIYQYDIPDNELYIYEHSEVAFTQNAKTREQTYDDYYYYFSKQYGHKSIANKEGEISSERSVSATEKDVGELYASDMLELIDYVSSSTWTYEWESVAYYGNNSDCDLRISAYDDNDISLDITFVDGLLTNFVVTQYFYFPFLASGINANFKGTQKATFSYGDSLDIPHPDLSIEEW